MIKFFRLIRQNLLSEGKTGKYLKYAIGEILLVAIGILMALQINNWNESRKKSQLKQSYIDNLINDLSKDTLQLKPSLDFNRDQLFFIDSTFTLLNGHSMNVENAFKLVKDNELFRGLRVVNSYNANTFNILISSGNIDLFSNDFTNELMELNRLQLAEKSVTELNKSLYFETYNNYNSLYIGLNTSFSNDKLEEILWKNQDGRKIIPIYINLLEQQRHTIIRYIEMTEGVRDKIFSILNRIKTNEDL